MDDKSTLRVGDTVGSAISMSNGTHLPIFPGNKTEWPVNMTIGQGSSKIGQMPSTHSVVMGALLLIRIKNGNIP